MKKHQFFSNDSVSNSLWIIAINYAVPNFIK